MKSMEAKATAEALVKNWVVLYGIPLFLISDQGRNFESEVFQEMCKILNIHKIRTTAMHPQGDSKVERSIQTIKKCLTCRAMNVNNKKWDLEIDYCLMAIRTSVEASTKYSPYYLLFGREMVFPIELQYGNPPHEPLTPETHAKQLRNKLIHAYKEVRENFEVAQARQKHYFDEHSHGIEYREGDRVWLANKVAKAFEAKWLGPYIILQKLGSKVYKIEPEKGGTGKIKTTVSFDLLKPCYTEPKDRILKPKKPRGRPKKVRVEIPKSESSQTSSSSESSDDENLYIEPANE